MRMNFGSGSVQPPGWVHVDKETFTFEGGGQNIVPGRQVEPDADGFVRFIEVDDGFYNLDVLSWFPFPTGHFDYIVANHSLSDLDHHQLPHALSELYRVLKPGGVLRVLVPDLLNAFMAWGADEPPWFPQGDDLKTVDERFCTFVTWFGTVGSVFTPHYLRLLLSRAGFVPGVTLEPGKTNSKLPEITSLDGDRTTALIMEGVK